MWRYEYPATYISFREEGKKIQSYRIRLTWAEVKLSSRIGYKKKSHTRTKWIWENLIFVKDSLEKNCNPQIWSSTQLTLWPIVLWLYPKNWHLLIEKKKIQKKNFFASSGAHILKFFWNFTIQCNIRLGDKKTISKKCGL